MSPSSTVDKPGPGDSETPRFDVFFPAPTGLPPGNGRLGVLGGAYNPITRAHLRLAHYAREQHKLHEVIFVLPRTLPNKPIVEVSLEHRLQMMRLGTATFPYISLGLCSHGLFIDICTGLKQIYPQKPEIFFITGRDAAERILSWPYTNAASVLRDMFANFQMLVFEREGKLDLPENPLIEPYSKRIHTLKIAESLDHISSTKVRQRLRTGQPIEELVPPEVASYIMDHNLYKKQLDQD